MPVPSTSRIRKTTHTTTSNIRKHAIHPRPLPSPISDPDTLATQLAETLNIEDLTKRKGKQKALCTPEQRLEAMRKINSASQQLSAIAQSGWKKSLDAEHQSKSQSTTALEASSTAARCLALLRSASKGDLNVERAAMSIMVKLVALELFDLALAALTSSHSPICGLMGVHATHLLSIPRVSNQSEMSTVLATLVSTYLSYAIIILTYTHRLRLCKDLPNYSSLIEWIPVFSSSGLSDKQLDSTLTKVYSVLMKVSASDIPPNDLFQIRMYALRCLAHTSVGTIENPESLWDQTCKVASALTGSLNQYSVSDAAYTVSSAFLALYTICEARADKDAFVSGNGFTSYCENWIGYASKTNDVRILQKIGQVMGQSSPPSASTDSHHTLCEDRDMIRQGTRLCAAFAQLLAVLEQSKQNDDSVILLFRDVRNALFPSEAGAIDPLITNLFALSMQDGVCNKDILRIAGKANRALGRVRRASLDVLAEQSTGKEVREECSRLLEVVIGLYENVIRTTDSHHDSDYLTHMLDTIFELSRNSLDLLDPRTYNRVYDLLAKAVDILSLSRDQDHLTLSSPKVLTSRCPERSEFIRCTSGAFYNIGGTLYQAGRYSSAIPFLKEGCRLGTAALVERDKGSKGEVDIPDAKTNSWLPLKEQLWRRFQLLAVCFMKIGDRRPAFDSFVKSVRYFPYSAFENVDKVSFGEIIGISPTVKELRGVIEKLTRLGTYELMLSAADVSLKSTELHSNIGTSVMGILMEWQVQSLEMSRSKEGAREVLPVLLKEILHIYRQESMPIRSLRVFAKALEFRYHFSLVEPEDSWLGVKSAEEAAQVLYNSKSFGKDEHLVRYRFEYYASIHLWLALHAHRRSSPHQVSLASKHTESACTILRTMLSTTSDKQTSIPKDSRGVKKSSKVTTSSAGKSKGKVAPPPKGKLTKTPFKRKDETRSIPLDFSSLTFSVDSIEALMNLLQLCAHISGMLSLTLPKINILDVLRKLAEFHSRENSDYYILSSSELALEYLRLGKGKRAKKVLNQALTAARSSQASDDARARFFLSFAASCAADADVKQSIKFYQEGFLLVNRSQLPNKQASAMEKIQTHVVQIEKTALAYEVFSSIQSMSNNISGSFDGLLKALRLWNRAFESLGRFQPPAPKSNSTETEESDPFDISSMKNALSKSGTPLHSISSQTQPPSTSRRIGDFSQRRILSTGLEWRIGEGLLNALFSLFHAYLERGSPREAQYFAEQAKELAASVNAPSGMCRAMVKNVEAKIYQGLIAEGSGQFKEIELCVINGDGDVHADLAELHRLKGDLDQRDSMVIEAQKHYEDAIKVIERVDQTFRLLDGVEFGYWLKYCAVMSAIALSAGSNNLSVSVSPTSVDIAKNLEHAEKLFWSYLGALGQKGYAPDIRESAMSIAIIKTFQASLGKFDAKTPLLAAGLLDASSSLTLRSEMLEAIVNKFPLIPRHEELAWPKLSDSGVPLLNEAKTALNDSDELDEISLRDYWESVRKRHQSYSMNEETFASSMVSELPRHWTVVHISVTEDKNTMFISRQRGGCQAEPLVFCIPLKGRREDAADEHLTFEDALKEMNEIVASSNETTKIAASIRHDPAARSKWWKERGALDTRLRELLENIEFCWLGAFKTILSANPHLSPHAISNLRIQFDRVFQRGLRLQDRKTKERAIGHKKMPSESWTPNRVTLDDSLIECFSTLSPDCRDEELEDLVYFILDLYQFHGVPVAIAEIDIDQVVVDLRSVMQEHAEKLKSVGHGRTGAFGYNERDHHDEHLFLVLDKNVQGLPWENIPILRGRSVSRIPSISFLLDRVQFARLRQSELGSSSNTVDRAVCDPTNAYYIINPSGDLERTEERFKPWLKKMEKAGWQGISGRAPSELQVLNALRTKDLVVYFGHGGAEQYVRSHRLRSLPRCAAVMLWGCSSGALRDMGDFDRVGTPLNYMLAGCPTLVANLWDVTDKDIDTFSQSVFEKLNLSLEAIKNQSSPERPTPMSVVQAVAESRNSCKLKYLTGAAPVVYGIPFYL
ncbi:hypothetical protein HHX47_DHR1000449 [Lentinula edodes]|nr:hypothetical protein HHX47_DHR1000449 [Lentinula edodes]